MDKTVFRMGELDEFVNNDINDHSLSIKAATKALFDDENLRSKALERAKEIIAEMHIDYDRESVRVLNSPTLFLRLQ